MISTWSWIELYHNVPSAGVVTGAATLASYTNAFHPVATQVELSPDGAVYKFVTDVLNPTVARGVAVRSLISKSPPSA